MRVVRPTESVVSGWMPNDEYDFTAKLEPRFDVARDIGLDQPAGFLANGKIVTFRQMYDQGIPPRKVITKGGVYA